MVVRVLEVILALRFPDIEDLALDCSQAAVEESAAVVRSRWAVTPQVGLILGTGLGSLADHISVEATWKFGDLPHFAQSTADGHRGRLLCGTLGGVPVIAMDGRFHAYEGYSPQQITFPVRVMSSLGVQLLIVSNASGGLNPSLNSGDILLIDDHVNLLGAEFACLNHVEQAARLLVLSEEVTGEPPVLRLERQHPSPRNNVDATGYYSPQLLEFTERVAALEQIELRRGTYIAMLGPNYETRAEYRWLRTLGDVVGMSTVPEVIVALAIGLPVIAFSMVTNVFRPGEVQQTSSEDVIAAASNAEPKLRRLVTRLLTVWNIPRTDKDGTNPTELASVEAGLCTTPVRHA